MGRKKLVRKVEPQKPPPEKGPRLEQQPKSRWRPTKNQFVWATEVAAVLTTVMVISIIWILWRDVIRVGGSGAYILLRALLTVVGIWILIRIGSLYEWTGFGERALEKAEGREIQPRKTLWDWMSLLLVPLMIAGIASFFTWWQTNSQQAHEARQQAQEQALVARQIAQLQESQAQYSALQSYIDQMSFLINERGLLSTEEGDNVFTLAQARTTATIMQLDGEQNQAVTRFLSGSGLLREPPLLANVVLEGAKLHKAGLQEANLAGTDLTGANLTDAVLISADFSAMERVGESTQVTTADLTKADLSRAALLGANLSRGHLKEATLTDATLQRANLRGANLQGADLSDAALQDADLSPATVPGFPPGLLPKTPTNLTDADLRDAALQSADLTGADLTDADLTSADLTDTKGWTTKQLDEAKSLKGATMPNGQNYEDWLKSREEDNSSS